MKTNPHSMKKVISFIFCLFLCLNVLGQNQDKVQELIREGIALHDKGEYLKAITTYKKALAIDKKSAYANVELGYTYQTLGDCKNALKYLNKTLKLIKKGDPDDAAGMSAFNIKGTCLDIEGNPKKAIQIYKQGIDKYPNDYLLRYNIALTLYKTKQFAQSEEHLIKAITLNPTHHSSHYLLGMVKAYQQQRVQSLLSLYFFLLLEPNSNRSTDALASIEEIWAQNVKQTEDNKFEISMNPLDESNEFAMLDLMLTLIGPIKDMIAPNESYQTKEQSFAENTENFFNLFKEHKDKEGFWWEFYVDFYNSIVESNNVEAYSYYISQSKGQAVQHWIEEYDYKITKLVEFLAE